jgi:3-phosphoshikimate 1-carboxyvinyltransferase
LGINFPIHSLGVMPMSNKVDLPPVLSVLAFFCEGTSKLTRTNRLDLKESDRIVAIDKLIKSLGGKIRWGRNFIKIKGGQILKDGVVDSFNYHRIAMAASIASIFCNKAIILNGAENVFKSYPKFFSDFKKLLF